LDPYRYLGFAFASADLLFEVDRAGAITFVVGSTQGLDGQAESDLIGRPWQALVHADDEMMVEAMFAGLGTGRVGPLAVRLQASDGSEPRYANLSACRLASSGDLACALAYAAPKPLSARATLDGDGYQDQSDFDVVSKVVLSAAAAAGHELDIALVEMPGLGGVLEMLGPRKAAALLGRFAGVLRAEAYAGSAPARLGDERFAVIRQKGSRSERFNDRLAWALAAEPEALRFTPQAQVLAIEPAVGSIDRSLRALRFAVDSFAERGAAGLAVASLNEAFTRSVQRTLAQAGEFGEIIKARKFSLVFQPIVSLKTGQCEHFETLVRFEDDTSPFKLIRMAEDLDLILELDLAIAEQALRMVRNYKRTPLKLAVNVSGRSIMDPWFIAEVRRLTSAYDIAPERLVFEVTESAAIDDLKIAGQNIQLLRDDGHKVCLDDFGAGASSYAYLQKLHVDVVKIDGRYVKELADDGRDAAMVRHLVNLCDELGVATVAEMITSPAIEDAARAAGVGFGQGYLYGQPNAEPHYEPRPKENPKRRGEQAQWA
jgi:EAL domain-containing protein (putative c-di-GMP-specific phosphodiesterase class I)